MNHKEHQALDVILLGKRFPDVHRWLDACFKDYAEGGKHAEFGTPFYHWIERHHLEALNTKYSSDKKRYDAAVLHILSDWISHLNTVQLPRNRQEVIELLDLWVKGIPRPDLSG